MSIEPDPSLRRLYWEHFPGAFYFSFIWIHFLQNASCSELAIEAMLVEDGILEEGFKGTGLQAGALSDNADQTPKPSPRRPNKPEGFAGTSLLSSPLNGTS